jgi:hypothetical protein
MILEFLQKPQKRSRKHKMDESLIIEIWDTFREYIPEKNRETAASQYVDFLVSKDVEAESLEGLLGYDPALDDAIKLILDENTELDEDDLDFEDEEDEDY